MENNFLQENIRQNVDREAWAFAKGLAMGILMCVVYSVVMMLI